MDNEERSNRSIAFFVFPVLRFPRNNREYYLTQELQSRGWSVTWLVPKSGENEGVPVEHYIHSYHNLDFRGRTFHLPIYLAILLRRLRIKYLWISGWSLRCSKEIYWLVRIMRWFGIETIYDTIDPKCLFDAAHSKNTERSKVKKETQRVMNEIYGMCRRVLCVTPEMKSLMIKKGADESKLSVARWGSDSKIFNKHARKNDFRRRLKIDETTILIGWLGGMGTFKGITGMLLPLVEKIQQDRDVHFLIAGDGPLFKDVEAWVASQENTPITLMGRLPYSEAAEFTASLDIYLVTTDPSSEYARAICPVKCYDAVAVETSLVTTRTPATEHLLQIYDDVHLCHYEIESFAKAVRHICDNIPSKRSAPGERLKATVSHQNVSRELADMLEELAATPL